MDYALVYQIPEPLHDLPDDGCIDGLLQGLSLAIPLNDG